MSYDALLIHTCDLIDKGGGAWGEPSLTVYSDIVCRIMYGNMKVKDFRGEEVVSYAKLFFKIDQNIRQTMLVRIYDTNEPAKFREHDIVKISRPSDSVKIHHMEVWIK